MIDFGIERTLKLRDIERLRSHQLKAGGSYVLYLSCVSFVFVSIRTPALVWIGPLQNHFLKGIWHSLPSLFLGWWSLDGLMNTPLVLAHNLLGGFDMTSTVLDPYTRDGDCKWESADVERRFQRRRFNLFLVLIAVGILFVIPMILYFLVDVVPRWIK